MPKLALSEARVKALVPRTSAYDMPTAPLVNEARGPWTKRGQVRSALPGGGQSCTPIGGHFLRAG